MGRNVKGKPQKSHIVLFPAGQRSSRNLTSDPRDSNSQSSTTQVGQSRTSADREAPLTAMAVSSPLEKVLAELLRKISGSSPIEILLNGSAEIGSLFPLPYRHCLSSLLGMK
jgi:hypothetical protein